MKTLIYCLFLSCSFSLLLGQVPYNQEFQVNTYTESYQDDPKVISLSDGKIVFCWASYGQDGDATGIFCQILNSDGTKAGDEFQVNTYTVNEQNYQSISSLSDSGFIICWGSNGQDGLDFGVFGQIFNSNGVKRGTEFQVNTYIDNDQCPPSISPLSDNGFI